MNSEIPNFDASDEDINAEINDLIEKMRADYGDFVDDLPPLLQSQWYNLLLESRISNDRQTIKESIEKFIKNLEIEVKKIKEKNENFN